MQVLSEPDLASYLGRLVAEAAPGGGRGLEAWQALLRAHATLMRQLETDLEKQTGLALADFDVLRDIEGTPDEVEFGRRSRGIAEEE